MSSKKDKRSKIPPETHRMAESLARELFSSINRPSVGQAEHEEETSYMRRPPKPEKN